MHPTLQLLERHSSELGESPVHWFDIPETSSLVKSGDKQFNLHWSPNNDARLDADTWPTNVRNVLFYPKAKDRLDWWLAMLSNSLLAEQTLWVVGENNGGIKSLPKRVAGHFNCIKIESARHCVLFELTLTDKGIPSPDWSTFSVGDMTCYTLPGVFSAAKLDRGTDVLLSALPELNGHILEFGSGCGVLTAHLAKQKQVKSVNAVEIDLCAVRSTNKTLAENGLADKGNVTWSAGTEQLEPKRYDALVTNPPFHKGIQTEYGPTETFFSEAHNWLKTGGHLVWVANDFLTYQHLLKGHFTNITQLVHRNGFSVYSAQRL